MGLKIRLLPALGGGAPAGGDSVGLDRRASPARLYRAKADVHPGARSMAVAAEGVETRARSDRVAAGGRTEGQGRSSGRPVPAREVPAREVPGSLGHPLGASPERAAA